MRIGIMQGRLSNKQGKPLQSFPWNSWKEEFVRAHSIGFKQIEWLVDGVNDDDNPIASVNGRKEISLLSIKYDVSINSLCAHALIDGKLLSNGRNQKDALEKFSKILFWASEARIEYVILPVMDAMSIQTAESKERLRKVLHEVVDTYTPKVLLESDLSAIQLKEFLDEVDLENIGVLYDLGNATAMGFDIESELKLLYPLIEEVHIKDRYINNGSSDRLGMANTSFDKAIQILQKSFWNGSLVLETPVFDNWKDEAEANFSFTKNLVDSVTQNIENRL
ncbi:uncharacterized protein METZ01_LOCUS311723 [marine metagenome]|uniref:Xylose isomerase-like TIM barrel domain-containing protein n=1 Tax=marine metagenome TaxID=408172 RepID=A0A382NCI6_9ZZZZ